LLIFGAGFLEGLADVGGEFFHMGDVEEEAGFELEELFEFDQEVVGGGIFGAAGFDGGEVGFAVAGAAAGFVEG